ncbi:hypothetical protein SXIM_41050 [Streptomyces xiamenensis]|uniref:Uncharacterized protein n=1 Tax=Streptomyces xiamenensis TaxID=408015 RepID=A0A0F7FXQ7_9ACTN|nr:hypothetical protein SXIM_41050 [Streptomyces xiamenensis]
MSAEGGKALVPYRPWPVPAGPSTVVRVLSPPSCTCAGTAGSGTGCPPGSASGTSSPALPRVLPPRCRACGVSRCSAVRTT